MTTRTQTVEYGFTGRTTSLATNTTLASATRHDFSAITLNIPETVNRTFISVTLEVTWQESFTAMTENVTGWRLGIKLGATAFSDTDITLTNPTNTGDADAGILSRDVTSYFVSNFGSAATQTCQVGFAMSTSVIASCTNINAKLYITYTYDDTLQLTTLTGATAVKTVRIPLQSNCDYTVDLTPTFAEIGTDTAVGATSPIPHPAPANQIPALNTFLPEAGKTFVNAFIEFYGQSGYASTTDTILSFRIDSGATQTAPTFEGASAASRPMQYRWVYDTATYSTASAHALQVCANTTPCYVCLGAVLVVTYTYNYATTTSVINSLLLPLDTDRTVMSPSNQRRKIDLWIPEYSPVLQQSALMVSFTLTNTVGYIYVQAGDQVSTRGYGVNYSSLADVSGNHTIIHRIDHSSSGIVLVHGKNVISTFCAFTADAIGNQTGLILYLNYTSPRAPDGCVNSRSIHSILKEASGAQIKSSLETQLRVPYIPESQYELVSVGFITMVRTALQTSIGLAVKAASGELPTGGYLPAIIPSNSNWDIELGCYIATGDFLISKDFDKVKRSSNSSEPSTKFDFTKSRSMLFESLNNVWHMGAYLWLTYGSWPISALGTISNYTGSGALPVSLWDNSTKELLTTTTSVSGSYMTLVNRVGSSFFAETTEGTRVGRSNNAVPIFGSCFQNLASFGSGSVITRPLTGSIVFNGIDEYLESSVDSAEFDSVNKGTWVLDAYVPYSTLNPRTVLAKGNLTTDTQWAISIVGTTTPQFRFYVLAAAGAETEYVTSLLLPLQQWTRCVFVYDGTQATASDRLKSYLYPYTASQGTTTGTPPTAMNAGTVTTLRAGRSSGTATSYFSGALGPMAYWVNKAATFDQAQELLGDAQFTTWTQTALGHPTHLWLMGNGSQDVVGSLIKDYGVGPTIDLVPQNIDATNYITSYPRSNIQALDSTALTRHRWVYAYDSKDAVAGGDWPAVAGNSYLHATGSNVLTDQSTTGLNTGSLGIGSLRIDKAIKNPTSSSGGYQTYTSTSPPQPAHRTFITYVDGQGGITFRTLMKVGASNAAVQRYIWRLLFSASRWIYLMHTNGPHVSGQAPIRLNIRDDLDGSQQEVNVTTPENTWTLMDFTILPTGGAGGVTRVISRLNGVETTTDLSIAIIPDSTTCTFGLLCVESGTGGTDEPILFWGTMYGDIGLSAHQQDAQNLGLYTP